MTPGTPLPSSGSIRRPTGDRDGARHHHFHHDQERVPLAVPRDYDGGDDPRGHHAGQRRVRRDLRADHVGRAFRCGMDGNRLPDLQKHETEAVMIQPA